ncbi:MAG: AAA family ATPase [Phycisphaerales bacterium]|nr:AAA family ATPase [Phycisphaerales bacterium]
MSVTTSMIDPPAPPRGAPPDQAARLRELVDELMLGTIVIPAGPVEAIPPPVPAPTGRIVAITSGKGGVGKTFTAVNLGIAMSRLGCRVTVVDADPGLANADVMCGLAPGRRLGDRADRELADLEIDAPGGFRLVPGSVGAHALHDESQRGRARFAEALRVLAARRDVVIVDTGAGVAPEITLCATAADLAIVVVTPEPTSMADAYAMMKCIRMRGAAEAASRARRGPRIGLVVNQSCARVEASTVYSRLSAVAERFLHCSPVLLGVISQDERVRRSIRARRPLLAEASTRGPARRELLALGLRLAAELGLGPGRGNSKPPAAEGLIARWRRRVSAGSAGGDGELS